MIRKKNIEPVPAYENWIESQTVQDLQAIRYNHNSIHMESLTIRERILTTKCPDVAHPIVFRGAVCADNGRFDRCESLWLHALELRQNNNVSLFTRSNSTTPSVNRLPNLNRFILKSLRLAIDPCRQYAPVHLMNIVIMNTNASKTVLNGQNQAGINSKFDSLKN